MGKSVFSQKTKTSINSFLLFPENLRMAKVDRTRQHNLVRKLRQKEKIGTLNEFKNEVEPKASTIKPYLIGKDGFQIKFHAF